MTFPQLHVSSSDFMNPGTLVGGFPAFLGLVQQLQHSNGGDIRHDQRGKRNTSSKMSGQACRIFFPPERQARQARMTQIVQNDQAARYKHLKRLYSRLSRLV